VITEDTGSGSDSDPAGANDPLTVSGYTQPTNGSVVVTATGSFTYTPASTFSGLDTFTYTIADGDGGSATATVTITVGAAAAGGISTIPDTCQGGTALLIVGTSGNDDIHVSPGPTSSTLKVTINGLTTTQARPSGRIIVFAGSGDDVVQVAGAIGNSVWLYGEAGNDRLDAGNEASGGNLLIGGDGNDDLSGGNGRDVMVGGQGADKLVGNANDDLLIAGGTIKDRPADAGHDTFWCDVLVEWTSAHTFQNRVHNLTNDAMSTEAGFNGLSYLNAATLRDDTSIDQIDMLNGSAGNDWFIYQSGEDKVVGESAVEQQYDTVMP
jgi:Ca2+-binding RTX toxin-like protein